MSSVSQVSAAENAAHFSRRALNNLLIRARLGSPYLSLFNTWNPSLFPSALFTVYHVFFPLSAQEVGRCRVLEWMKLEECSPRPPTSGLQMNERSEAVAPSPAQCAA